MPRRKEPRIPDAVLDQLLAGADPQAVFDPNGLLDALKKALAERVLNAEMDHHLAGEEPGNRRNGYGKKTVITDTGQIELEVPRDRQARFDPQLIAKYQRRFPGFDDKIISMYARGMSTREIVGHLRDLYRIEVSPDLISAVTDAVMEDVATWQARPLEPVYPLIFFDALRSKSAMKGWFAIRRTIERSAYALTAPRPVPAIRPSSLCAGIPPTAYPAPGRLPLGKGANLKSASLLSRGFQLPTNSFDNLFQYSIDIIVIAPVGIV